MPLSFLPVAPDALPHPGVWRASELSRQPGGRCVPVGHEALAPELPGGGWPCGSLIELLLARPGVGEMQLLQPALKTLSGQRSVVLLQPPYVPHIASLMAWRSAPMQAVWLRPKDATDALWAAEQVLKAGTCAALLAWLPQAPPTALRRLHAAAQGRDTLFIALRPAQAQCQPSPAILRLTLQPAPGGLALRVVKRRGPVRDTPLYLSLYAGTLRAAAPSPEFSHVSLDSPSPASTESRRPVPSLAGSGPEADRHFNLAGAAGHPHPG